MSVPRIPGPFLRNPTTTPTKLGVWDLSTLASALPALTTGYTADKAAPGNVWNHVVPSAATRAALASAISSLGANKGTVHVLASTAIDDDLTVAANVTLKCEPGAVLTVSSGKTLTVNGPFEAPPVQCFAGAGSVLFGAAAREIPVEWFGAIGDGTTDDTAAIQAAISAAEASTASPRPSVRAGGSGTYHCADSVLVRSCRFILDGTMIRKSADTSTDPVILICNDRAEVTGHGIAKTEKDSPRGIVCIGPVDFVSPSSVNWTRLSDLTLWGVKSAGNIGLNIDSNEGVTGTTTYFANVSDLFIRAVGDGVKIRTLANAHQLRDLHFYDVGTYSYNLIGALENNITGGFTHYSANATAIINVGAGCDYNQFHHVAAEPGGSTCLYYIIAAGCKTTVINGVGNCFAGWADSGENTISYSQAHAKFGPFAVDFARELVTISGHRVHFADAAPVSGVWTVGDVVFNTAAAASGKVGWVNTSGGWKAFGAIDS